MKKDLNRRLRRSESI